MGMDQNGSINSRKRTLNGSGNEAEPDLNPTPTPIKRQKVGETIASSPSTPKALTAIASAISGVLGYGRQSKPTSESNGQKQVAIAASGSPLSSKTNGFTPRSPADGEPEVKRMPALKLSVLRDTIWDNGDLPPPKKKAASSRATAKPITRPASMPAGATQSPPQPNAANSPTTIRSILTPVKKRGRPRKNVSFNKDARGEVFFEDLPKTPVARKKTRITKAQKAQQEDDGIVCEMCSKPDSKAPNEIILCDSCDFAVHQLCYDVAEIPEGDWLCKSCLQEDVLKATSKPAGAGASTAEPVVPVEVPDIPNLEHHLGALQRVLLDRCTGRRRIRLCGHEEPHEKARQLVEQTVLAGEGNSMLVIGPRGCGKTTMVEGIIVDLAKEHRHEFHVVRLNGFIHTDDKLALKDIWRQLGKEMEMEDDLLNRANYADTMASLLALLSHPSEITGADDGVTSQSVVFVIDEFDMFATHARQTLLYNLFDIAQSRKAPIAVLGCTTRLDVVEMLEKRVKSRFSHRYVYLAPARSLAAYWQICRQGLMVDLDDIKKEGLDASVEGFSDFHKYWTQKIEELYKQRQFQHLLQYHFFTTVSVAAFFAEWVLPLSRLSARDVRLSSPTRPAADTSLTAPDSRLQLLSTLSDLDMGMLIAAARLDIVAHTDTVNFAMTYDEYSSLVARQRLQSSAAGMMALGGHARVWSRGVAGIAWERLILLGLLTPAGMGGGGGGGGSKTLLGHGGLDGKMWKVEVGLEEIPAAVKMGPAMARWCREI